MSNRTFTIDRLHRTHDSYGAFQDQMLVLGRKAVADAGWPMPEIKGPPTRALIDRAADLGILWVAVENERVVGFFIGRLNRFPDDPARKYLSSYHFYVDPERRAGAAKALVREVKKFCDKTQIEWMLYCNYGGEDLKKKDRFFKIMGLEYIGGTFRYGGPQ